MEPRRYWRPDWFTARVTNPVVRWLGAASTLEVPRRRSGTPQRVPVNVLDHGGRRYLVAVRGETEWVRNVRAAGRCAIGRRGRRTAYRTVELPVADRAEVIAAYRARWDSQVRRFWAQLPDPEDHPVFRLEPAPGAG
jgi:deazaflavin-dependent oxidoreductase (nitroreductase family)